MNRFVSANLEHRKNCVRYGLVMNHKTRLIKQILAFVLLNFLIMASAYSEQEELLEMSVEDLLNVEVISTAKKAKSLNDSAAAIFVISQEDINRIGATSIPEALRLAPGLDVARIDGNKWAISVRGFNGRFANKLLVLIDGRNTYTRAFAGVYWENQDVLLEDVERIEVIRGPGATLWGANAVNGVINIITKHSADTLGAMLVSGVGTEEQGFGALRYGTELGKSSTARAYVKGFNRDENSTSDGASAEDDWQKVQGGFRIDSQLSERDTFTIQGDAYYNDIQQNTFLPTLTSPFEEIRNENIEGFGGNFMLRQQHNFSSTSDYSLQIVYDFYQREELYVEESRHSLDLDFQHRFALFDWNDIIWGLRYRYNHDDFVPGHLMTIDESSRNDQLFSGFIQDEITLIDNALWLTIGSKFEHNDYSGFEVQPTARLMWIPHHQHRIWAAVSRSVRTPSRLEHSINFLQTVFPPQSLQIPLPAVAVTFESSDSYDSEKVMSYELGYRTTVIDDLSIDFTAFYNDYDDVRSGDLVTLPAFTQGYINQPLTIRNSFRVQTYGFEFATVWQVVDWWRLDANYSLLKMEFSEQEAMQQIGQSPQQRVFVRSAMSFMQQIDFDMMFRFVDSNAAVSTSGFANVKDYFSLDMRLGWKPIKGLEVSLVGQNLLAEKRREYRSEILVLDTYIDRGMYGKLVWEF